MSSLGPDGSFVSPPKGKPHGERKLVARQRAEIARRVLHGLPRREREMLRRFYLLGQSQQQICDEMGMERSQFLLLKSEARDRFWRLAGVLSDEERKHLPGSIS